MARNWREELTFYQSQNWWKYFKDNYRDGVFPCGGIYNIKDIWSRAKNFSYPILHYCFTYAHSPQGNGYWLDIEYYLKDVKNFR